MRKIAGVHHDVRFARSVGQTLNVMCGGFLFAEFFNGHHVETAFGQVSEQVWKLGVHLVDVFAIKIENFFARVRMQFWIGFDRRVKGFQIRIAELLGNAQHEAFDFFYLFEADLVNLFRR